IELFSAAVCAAAPSIPALEKQEASMAAASGPRKFRKIELVRIGVLLAPGNDCYKFERRLEQARAGGVHETTCAGGDGCSLADDRVCGVRRRAAAADRRRR